MGIDLTKTQLFCGIAPAELDALLQCLDVRKRQYKRGEHLLWDGSPTEQIGVILSGRAIIQIGDVWSNNSVLGSVGPGETFAEAFACVPGEPVLANVTAEEDATALLLNVGRVIAVCSRGCGYHIRLVQNLLALYARKNLQLSRRILHTGSKTIRGRVLSYFSECVKRMGSYSFDIPYSRQQLADYLGVERSALSNELSKMQKDGIIRYEKIILRSWPPVRCARTQLISGIIEKYCRVSVPRQGRLSDPDASCCPDSKFKLYPRKWTRDFDPWPRSADTHLTHRVRSAAPVL